MYKIISPRIGTVGETYTPEDGTNVEALLAGGFIEVSKPKTPKQETANIQDNKE